MSWLRALVVLALAASCCIATASADDNAEANGLFVEAVQLFQRAQTTQDPVSALALYDRSLANLDRIVQDYPKSDLAVRIISGQPTGRMSREVIEQAAAETRDEVCWIRPDPQCLLSIAYRTAWDIDDAVQRGMMTAEIALVLAEMGDEAAARDAIAQALQSARQVDSDFERDLQLPWIVAAQAKIGDLDAARQTIRSITDPLSRVLGVENIVAAQLAVGDVHGALRTVQRVDDASARIGMLLSIAHKHAGSGNATGAQETLVGTLRMAHNLKLGGDRAAALAEVATAHAKMGETERALEIAHSIEGASEQATALRIIAAAQAEHGNRLAARKTFAQALRSASRITYSLKREEALSATVVAQAEAGDMDAAVEVGRGLEDDFTRATAFKRIAALRAQTGDIAGALEMARGIDFTTEREEALREVAGPQARAGNVGAALQMARELEYESNRAWALRAIAAAQAVAGDIDAALKIAGEITGDSGRAEALVTIAVMLAKDGNIRDATQVARRIDSASRRATALLFIVITSPAAD